MLCVPQSCLTFSKTTCLTLLSATCGYDFRSFSLCFVFVASPNGDDEDRGWETIEVVSIYRGSIDDRCLPNIPSSFVSSLIFSHRTLSNTLINQPTNQPTNQMDSFNTLTTSVFSIFENNSFSNTNASNTSDAPISEEPIFVEWERGNSANSYCVVA